MEYRIWNMRRLELLFDLVEADHLAAIFIPQSHGGGFQTLPQSEDGGFLEEWILLVASLQFVVRNFRAEMVYVMEADVAAEPLQDAWQFVIRASQQRRGRVIPIGAIAPVSILVLMLYIEEPHAGRAGDEHNRREDQQERLQSDQPGYRTVDGQ
jgi:hypothetical protein